MRLRNILAAATMLAAMSLAGNAQAGPVFADTQAAGGLDLLKVHTTCHNNIRRHFDPDYGESVEHIHRGRNCRAVIVDVEEEDCHANPQSHRIAGYGRRPILHRHRGANCRVVVLEEEEDDCHANPDQHPVPGLGNIWHRHIGPSCRVQELEVYRPGRSTRGCIQAGPIRVCP